MWVTCVFTVVHEPRPVDRRIHVDYTGPMDTVVYQWEFESLDEYFAMERGTFIEPDEDTQALIDAMNSHASSGYEEIYEVIT